MSKTEKKNVNNKLNFANGRISAMKKTEKETFRSVERKKKSVVWTSLKVVSYFVFGFGSFWDGHCVRKKNSRLRSSPLNSTQSINIPETIKSKQKKKKKCSRLCVTTDRQFIIVCGHNCVRCKSKTWIRRIQTHVSIMRSSSTTKSSFSGQCRFTFYFLSFNFGQSSDKRNVSANKLIASHSLLWITVRLPNASRSIEMWIKTRTTPKWKC